ncbi:uncharacterized protein LOC125200221 [Salvia hispanica]|uniref:uncharacterized protein LOC125200221 n=1 Tax=Salvia hispanica TaxID=49212 RepID=UPI002009123B|nr:uncharacterized protein LOC125200221 [Salvia hispanica]
MSRRYKPTKDRNDPRLEVGLRFNTKAVFTDLIRHQGVQLGKKLRLKKNDNIRCIAYCKGLLRSKKVKAGRYEVISWDDIGQFVEKVHMELKITISVGKAKRAMARARKLIEGDTIKQYKRLYDYRAEILRTNPWSTVVLATRRLSDGTDKFNGIYIAYEACKPSFKQHCRRMIGLDGCHLKRQGKGILLTAIGLDPNDQIFPVAYGVVAIENTDTWRPYQCVRSCCHNAEHRFCVWHMHNNFKKVFPSPTLKDKIWEAVRSANAYAFEKVMEEVKQLNTAAHTWLTVHTAKESWSRAFFGFEAHCDILVNNISECYSKVLLIARDKLLYGMLECIRMYLMDRITTRQKMAAKLEDCVGPKIRKKLEKLKEKVRDCMVREACEWVYQVNTKFNEQFVVDIRDRSCSSKCYSTETLQLVYAPIIYPVHGPDTWPRTPHPDIVPPNLTRLPGRPKGARQKTAEELAARSKVKTKAARIAHQVVTVRDGEDGRQKMSRKGLMPEYKCRLCGEKGHNKRRCPQGIQLGKSKGSMVRRERNRDKEQQTCILCHQPDHNRASYSSAVADMFAEPGSSYTAASVPAKKKPPSKKKGV